MLFVPIAYGFLSLVLQAFPPLAMNEQIIVADDTALSDELFAGFTNGVRMKGVIVQYLLRLEYFVSD